MRVGAHACGNLTVIEPHRSIACVVGAGAFFSDFEKHNVTLEVNGLRAVAPSAVCHKLSAGAKCLCGAGREQIDGVCTECSPGEFNLNERSDACAACPAGASCTRGTSIVGAEGAYDPVLRWRTSPGYWVDRAVWQFCPPDDPACFLGRVERCADADERSACPGGAPGVCGVGYEPGSILCGRCASGYSRDEVTQSCTRCEGRESAYFQVAGIVSGVLLLLYAVYAVLRRAGVTSGIGMLEVIENVLDHPVVDLVDDAEIGALSGLANIVTCYVQVLGQSLLVFSIDFPSYFAGVLDVLKWFTLPMFSFMGAQCFAYFSAGLRYSPFLMAFSFQAALPWFIIGFYLLVFLAIRSGRPGEGSIFVKVVAFLLVYFHPNVSAMMFRLYNCRSVYAAQASAQRLLRADPEIKCFLSQQWRAMAAVSAVMLVAFIAALPVGIYVLLMRLHAAPLRNEAGKQIMKRERADGGRAAAFDMDGKPIVVEVEVPCTMLDDPRMARMFGTRLPHSHVPRPSVRVWIADTSSPRAAAIAADRRRRRHARARSKGCCTTTSGAPTSGTRRTRSAGG